jgi:hypothetical protein
MKKGNNRKGLHLHRVHPILFGGNPVDMDNIKFVTRLQHAEFVVFWNRKVNEVKDSK